MTQTEATWLSNGLGGQSMYLLWAIREKRLSFPVPVSITADTGSEEDCQLMTGERISAPQFFERYVMPLAASAGITALFVRSQDKHGQPLPPLKQMVQLSSERAAAGGTWKQTIAGLSVPLFTNDESQGRLRQSCTDKWKARAIRQEARRRGIKLLRSLIGYHYDEAARRINAVYTESRDGHDIYQPFQWKKWPDGSKTKVLRKRERQIYPLVDWQLGREAISQELQRHGIPFLVTSECDMCPHQDYERWMRHSPAVLQEIANLEAQWGGKLTFTDKRKPLFEALAEKATETPKAKPIAPAVLFNTFGCGSELCGI